MIGGYSRSASRKSAFRFSTSAHGSSSSSHLPFAAVTDKKKVGLSHQFFTVVVV
jgi:hypothetical protein